MRPTTKPSGYGRSRRRKSPRAIRRKTQRATRRKTQKTIARKKTTTSSATSAHTFSRATTPVRTRSPCHADVTDLSWSPDSRFLCSASVDCRVLVWSLEAEAPVHVLEGHTAWVSSVDWDPCDEVGAGGDWHAVHRVGGEGQHAEAVEHVLVRVREDPLGAAERPVRQRALQGGALVPRRQRALRDARGLRRLSHPLPPRSSTPRRCSWRAAPGRRRWRWRATRPSWAPLATRPRWWRRAGRRGSCWRWAAT